MAAIYEPQDSFRQGFETLLVTTIAAGTASAGHIFSMRWVSGLAMRLRALEVEFILTTAFGAAQEMGFDGLIGRAYSASPTGATAITLAGNDGKTRTGQNNSRFVGAGDIRIASTAAMTVGTVTLDQFSFVRGSFWAGAVGAQQNVRRYDFTGLPLGGHVFATSEGFILRNTILMGATGVGKWKFTPEWDEGVLTVV
jgi:hypothetical protein